MNDDGKTAVVDKIEKTHGTGRIPRVFLTLALGLAVYASIDSCKPMKAITDSTERLEERQAAAEREAKEAAERLEAQRAALRKQRTAKEVNNAIDGYQAEVRAIIDEQERFLRREGKDNFEKIRPTIPGTVKRYNSFKHMSKVIFTVARDKVRKTNKCEEMMTQDLGQSFIAPCQRAGAEVVARHEAMLRDLEAARVRAGESLYDSLSSLNAAKDISMPLEGFATELSGVEKAMRDLRSAQVWTTVSAGFEIVFIRSTLGSIARLGARAIAKATSSAALPLVDGPLPIGDIVAVGGLAWTAYDIHTLCRKLPRELNKNLDAALTTLETETLAKSRTGLVDAEKAYLNAGNSMRISAIRAIE